MYFPQLIDRVETAFGQVLFEYPVRIRSELGLKDETLMHLERGLDYAVNEELGTAYNTRLDYVRVAGKTGTAQVTSRRVSNSEVEWKYRDHAWFAAYAPRENAEIVIVVFLEHGGGGSSDAAPIAVRRTLWTDSAWR